MRWGAVLAMAAVLAGGLASCSSAPKPPPAAAPPPSGHASPQGATAGFIRGLVYGGQRACIYVVPADMPSCQSAFPPTTSFSVSGLGLGQTTVRGAQALVTVTGKLCTTQGGSTTCATNDSLTTGQPHGPTAAAFAAAYSPSQLGSIGKRAIPCRFIGGRWYVDLGA